MGAGATGKARGDGPWSPVGDLRVLGCWGLGETDGSRDRGSLRLVLQPEAVEWEWGIGSGSPSSLLRWGYTDGERKCHPEHRLLPGL